MTMRGPAALRIFAVAVMVMVTGSGPQLKVMTPPAATAATTASEVQLAGVPSPITWSGREVSSGCASGGTGARPSGLPARSRGGGGSGDAVTSALAGALTPGSLAGSVGAGLAGSAAQAARRAPAASSTGTTRNRTGRWYRRRTNERQRPLKRWPAQAAARSACASCRAQLCQVSKAAPTGGPVRGW